MIANPKRYSRKEQIEYNQKMGYDEGIQILKREPLTFKMNDGYVINGDISLIPGSNKYCLLAHGHGTSREGAIRYSLIFHNLGYSTIVFDERNHGDNLRLGAVTMGYLESKDIAEIIQQIYERYGQEIHLALQGVSMGASSVLLSTKYGIKVDYIVSDCAYGRLKDVIGDIIERSHFKKELFLSSINFYLKTLYHFSFLDCEPIEAVKKSKIPTLFIHGDKDTFVNVKAAHELYEASISEIKDLEIFNASHASSITSDHERYQNIIKEFEDKIKP